MDQSEDGGVSAHHLAVGGIVYATVSAAWVGIGLAVAPAGAPLSGHAIGALLATGLFIAAVATLRKARARAAMPRSDPRTGRAFGIVSAAEGVAIGVGSGALAASDQAPFIASWVALCVGLHFFPLARILGQRIDHLLGLLVVAWTVAATLAFDDETRPMWVAAGTAALLWFAGAGRLVSARRRT